MICRGGAIPAAIDGEPVEIAYLSDNTLQSIRPDHAEDYIDLTCLTAIEDQGEGLFRLTFAAGEWLLIDASAEHSARLLAGLKPGRVINNAPAFSLLPPSAPPSVPTDPKPGWLLACLPALLFPVLLWAIGRGDLSTLQGLLVALLLIAVMAALSAKALSQRRAWTVRMEVARRDHARYIAWFGANGLPIPASDPPITAAPVG